MPVPCHFRNRSTMRITLAFLLTVYLSTGTSLHGESPITWIRHATSLPQGIWAVEAIDTNDDGHLELIAVGDSMIWALSSPKWIPVRLARTEGGRTIHAVALDCDADGDLDLALGRSSSAWIQYRQSRNADAKPPLGEDWTVSWIENTGRAGDVWPLHILDKELHGVHGVAVGDVDRDGTPDLLADSFAGPHLESSLAWFRAPRSAVDTSTMKRRLITKGQATGRPHYMELADINSDGRGDVLLGASTEGSFTWWEQPSDLNRTWKRHVIAWEPGATHPRAADLNGDGRIDVIGSTGHGQGIYWYQAPTWRRHTIDPAIRDVHAFDAADLDQDGDVDCAGCSFSEKVVRWWENLGAGSFRAHQVDIANEQEAYDVKIADLDGDRRLDILLAGRRSDNVVWYRNTKP